jgi:phosphatidylserine decarboxylase
LILLKTPLDREMGGSNPPVHLTIANRGHFGGTFFPAFSEQAVFQRNHK